MQKDYGSDNTQSQETPMSLSIPPSSGSSLDDGLTASMLAIFPKSQLLRL